MCVTALPSQVLKLLEGKDGGGKKKHPKLGDQARMTAHLGYLTLPPNRSTPRSTQTVSHSQRVLLLDFQLIIG